MPGDEGDACARSIATRSCFGAAATGGAGVPAPTIPWHASWFDSFEIDSDDAFSAAVGYIVSMDVAAVRPSCKPFPTAVIGGATVSSESSPTTGFTGGAAIKPTNATGKAGTIPCIGGCAELSRRGPNACVVILT